VKEVPVVEKWTFGSYSPDGTRRAIGNTAGEIAFIDLATETSTTRRLDFVEGSGLAYSPDNRWLAVASNFGYVRVWDTRTWSVVVTLRGFRYGCIAPTFSPDGSRLAASSGSGNEGIKVWATDSWREVVTLQGDVAASSFGSLSFSPDGNWLGAGGNNRTVHLWYAPTWEEIDRAERATLNAELSPLNSR
jgi:WD40 repeat protein